MRCSAVLLIGLALCSSGCALMGQQQGETVPQVVSTFKPGVTTFDEVKQRIGAPKTVVSLSGGGLSASFNNSDQEAIKGTVRGTAEGAVTDNVNSATSAIPYASTAVNLARNVFDIEASHSSTAYFCTLTFDARKFYAGGGCSQN